MTAAAASGLPLPVAMATMIILGCGLGIVSYHWIESPINRYFQVRRKTATAA